MRETLAWSKTGRELGVGEVSDVAVLSPDCVMILTRFPSGLLVLDATGAVVNSWGTVPLGDRPHGLTVGPDRTVYIVDGDHCVRMFDLNGRPLGVIGESGYPSNTGMNWAGISSTNFYPRLRDVVAAGPFNAPTSVVVGSHGDLFVADGYGNARVHRFAADGTLIESWGRAGSDPGEFRLVHSISMDRSGRLLVADRENDRVQVFSQAGELLDVWDSVRRPLAVAQARDGRYVVGEMASPAGRESFVHGVFETPSRASIAILDEHGMVECRLGDSGDPFSEGGVLYPHGLDVDSDGSLYITQVVQTALVTGDYVGNPAGVAQDLIPVVQKFTVSG